MRVLLLGGTGAIGASVHHVLRTSGATVTVTTRRKPTHNESEYILGNAMDEQFITQITSVQWDCIVDFMCYSTDVFRKRAPLLLRGTKQYVFLSSARVFASSSTPVTETSPLLLHTSHDAMYLKTDEYSLAKARQESILLGSDRKNWTIVRPYITYSNQRLQLGPMEKEAWLFRALAGRTVIFPSETGNKTTNLTNGLDAGLLIAGLIGNNKALGEVFIVAGNHHRTWNEILAVYSSTIQRATNRKPKIMPVSTRTFLGAHSGKYQLLFDRIFDRRFDNSKILSVMSAPSFISPELGLSKALTDFLHNQSFLDLNGRDEGAKDRITGEYTRLRHFKNWRNKVQYWLTRHGLTNQH